MFLKWLTGIARRFVAWLESLAPIPPPPPPPPEENPYLAELETTYKAMLPILKGYADQGGDVYFHYFLLGYGVMSLALIYWVTLDPSGWIEQTVRGWRAGNRRHAAARLP